ncbi:MAG: ABC transporter permease [Dysgonamonadaceae bacterium]|jgi:putative ABC transport system permease protein|nr:ABC transporter permease [Dysgonamonadaceae bacterium]
MYKIYLKQALRMLKEDKVISIISIFGTALAITMIMVVILSQRIKTTNIAPEINRERTMYIKWLKEETSSSTNIIPVSGSEYKQFLQDLKTPECVSLQSRQQAMVSVENNPENIKADVMETDSNFWIINRFSFQEGKPFSKEDFQSGFPHAVISKSLAQRLFNGNPALGKEFSYKERNYKICGIVNDISTLCDNAYAQIWLPCTAVEKIEDGEFSITILAKNKKDFSEIKKEVREREIRNNPEIDTKKISFIGPYSRKELLVKEGNMNNDDPNMKKDTIKHYLIIAILLLIPAVNLSGFSLFKIISRTSEIGIRKAFGATQKSILLQVLYENLLTSLIGGIIGLITSYWVAIALKDRLFTFNIYDHFMGENTIPVSAFLSPWVFFYVFLVCLAMNLLSSGIPAWKASRLNIADSIKQ